MGLKGIRVLDLTWLLPGPFATVLLADLGADVIKIEQPGRGDYTREMLPGVYQMANRNKRSASLNLKADDAREAFYRMVRQADVVVEAFRPGVAARLGVDYERLQAINPAIVYCSISGFGQKSPFQEWPGHDVTYLGVGGGLSIPGDLGYPPVRPTLPVADLGSAMYAALAMTAAVWEARDSGRGDYIDLAMVDAITAWSTTRLADVLWRNEPPQEILSAFNRSYATADGRRITLSVVEDHFFERFCRAVGREDWLNDPRLSTHPLRIRHSAEMLPQLEALMKQRGRDEWLELFGEHLVPSGPVYGPTEVFDNPHVNERGLIQELTGRDGKPTRQYRFPAIFRNLDTRVRSLPPALGEHTVEVLGEFGFSAAEIDRLHSTGAASSGG